MIRLYFVLLIGFFIRIVWSSPFSYLDVIFNIQFYRLVILAISLNQAFIRWLINQRADVINNKIVSWPEYYIFAWWINSLYDNLCYNKFVDLILVRTILVEEVNFVTQSISKEKMAILIDYDLQVIMYLIQSFIIWLKLRKFNVLILFSWKEVINLIEKFIIDCWCKKIKLKEVSFHLSKFLNLLYFTLFIIWFSLCEWFFIVIFFFWGWVFRRIFIYLTFIIIVTLF